MMRILIVDDDPVTREWLCAVLAPYGHCDTALDAQTAFQRFLAAQAANDPYGMLTLDVQLPGSNGRTLLNQIRTWEDSPARSPNQPRSLIFMVTSDNRPQNVMETFRHGCEGYFVKPVQAKAIYSTLERFGLRLPAQTAV